jgi:hypothetical protein
LGAYFSGAKQSDVRPFEISPEKVSFSTMAEESSSCVKNLFGEERLCVDTPFSMTELSPNKLNSASTENQVPQEDF